MAKRASLLVATGAGVLLLTALPIGRTLAEPPTEPTLGDHWARYFLTCETYKAAKEREYRSRVEMTRLLMYWRGEPPWSEMADLRNDANVLANLLPGLKRACEQTKVAYEQALNEYVTASIMDLIESPPAVAAAPPRNWNAPPIKKPPTRTTRRPPSRGDGRGATAQAVTSIILFGIQQGWQSRTYGTRSGPTRRRGIY